MSLSGCRMHAAHRYITINIYDAAAVSVKADAVTKYITKNKTELRIE
jgi:hypothetical protein